MSSRSQSLSRLPLPRVAAFVASTLVLALAVVLPGGTASAAVTPLIAQAFTGSSVSNDWYLPPAASGTNATCLTAGTSTTQTPIPGCNLSPVDASGSGTLRITSAVGNAVGSAFYQTTLPTSQGLDIKYDTWQYNGAGSSGADGIGFALTAVDPTNPAPPTVTGPLGGSLGYSATSSLAGIPYGYLGYGVDVWGNFANSAFGGSGCTPPAGITNNTAYPEAMTVRGAGNGLAGYCILGSTAQTYRVTSGGGSSNETLSNLNGQYLDRYNVTTRPTPVAAEIAMNPTSSPATTASGISVPANSYLIKVTPYVNNSSSTAGTPQTLTGALPTTLNSSVLAGFPAAWINPTTHIPYQVSFGWVASTGGAQEVHEIADMNATTLSGQLPVLGLVNSDNESGHLVAGNKANIVLTPRVDSSGGPESSTMTVTDTLPTGLTPGTATSPSDWTCSTSGQKVTCSWTPPSAVAAGTVLPDITIPVTVSSSASGTLSNVARIGSVDGAPDAATGTETVTTFAATKSAATIAHGATETLSESGLPVNATGTVTFTSGATALCTATLPTTSCTAPTTLAPGTYATTATYSGDGAYAGQTAATSFTVTKGTATLTASANPSSQGYGTAVTLSAAGVPADATGTLTFTSGSTLCTASLPMTSCTTSPTLAIGSYPVTLSWGGDVNYNSATATTSFSIVKGSPSFTASATPPSISYGDVSTLAETGLPAGATGTVTFTTGSTTWCTATLPTTSCSTPSTAPVGTHAVTATYSGDSHYNGTTATTSFSVNALATALSVSVAPSTTAYGTSVTLSESGLPSAATGTVTFTSGGTTLCTVTLGSATGCTTPATLDPGSYPVTGTYSGDPIYASSTDTTTFAVTKSPTLLKGSATPASVTYGNRVVLGEGGLPAGATGTVTFTAGGTTLCSVDVATASTCSTPNTLAVGSYSVSLAYSGDVRYLASTASTSFSVAAASTSLSVSASPSSVQYGTAVTLTSAGLPAQATGTVTFTAGGTTLCTVTLSSATSCSTSSTLMPNSYAVTGTYSGDASYAGSTASTSFVVTAAPTAVTGTAPATTPYGQPVTLSIAGLPADATGVVTLTEGSGTLCTVVLPDSSCVVAPTPSTGYHNVTVTYAGDAHYSASSSGFVFQVVQATTAVTATATPSSVSYGDTVTLTPASLPADATGTVDFSTGGTPLCSVNLATATSCQPAAQPAGTYPVDVAYSGDVNYLASTGSTSFDVGVATTTFSVSADPSTAAYGTVVTLTPAGLPSGATGTVAMNVAGSTLCSVDLATQTSCTAPSTLAVGAYSVTADYSGDTNFGASSATTAFTVVKATVGFSMAATPASTAYGLPATLSVSGLPTGASGTVSFATNGSPLCQVTLPATSCSAPTSLDPASYPVVATYSGNTSYNGGTAAASFDVVQASTSVTASSTPSSVAYGSPYTLTGAGLPAAATGTVTFTTGGSTLCTVALPTVSCALSTAMGPGTHTVTVTYSGDTDFAGSQDATSVTVGYGVTAITASATPGISAYGDPVTLAVGGLPAGATGTVTFDDGTTTLCTATLPAVSCSGPATLAVGTYNVTATYSGDGNWSGSTATTSFRASKATVFLSATATPGTVPHGTAVTLAPADIPGDATGTVTFTSGGTTLCSVTLGGPLSCDTSAGLAVGNYPVDVHYSGDADYGAADATTTFSVTVAGPTMSVTATPSSVVYGDTVTLAVGSLPADATGTVAFQHGGTTWCTVTLPGTTCNAPAGLAPDTYPVTAAYSGDGNYTAVSTGTSFVVGKASTSLTAAVAHASRPFGTADTVSFTGLPADATGAVTFASGSTTLCTVTIGAGASCDTPVTLVVATYPVTATYGGDVNYAGASAVTTFDVVKAAPTLTAAADPGAAVHGTKVTLSLTGLPSTATGTVRFTANGVELCTATVDANTACLTSDALATGDYHVVASYSGDDNFTAQQASTGFSVGPVADGVGSTAPAGTAQTVVISVPAGDTVALVDASGDPVDTVTVPGEGTYVLDPATGTITFTPDVGFAGTATGVRYRLTDSHGVSSTGTYQPVAQLPAAPTASGLTSSGASGKRQSVTVTVPQGDTVTLLDQHGVPVTSVVVPGQGTYRIDPASGVITFTPLKGFAGKPTPVAYQVSDVYGQKAQATYAPDVAAAPKATATPTPTKTGSATPTTAAPAPTTTAATGSRGSGSSLPFTGLEVGELLTAVVLLLAGGTGLVLVSRRRRRA